MASIATSILPIVKTMRPAIKAIQEERDQEGNITKEGKPARPEPTVPSILTKKFGNIMPPNPPYGYSFSCRF